MNRNDEQVPPVVILAGLVLLGLIYAHHRRRFSGTAYGTAAWASDRALRAAGMLAGRGLVLGRTLRGALLRLPNYTHVLLVGGTGAGKGIGIIIPNLLTYLRGSLVVFDVKGDLFATTARWRARMRQRVIRLAPFDGGTDAFNPLDAIPSDSPLLVDSARAMAEALVARKGTETDPHWNDKAVQVITALLVLVLLRFKGEDRNLNAVEEIASDPELVASAADKLRDIGGIPARLGNQLKVLFAMREGVELTKEGAGVMSTVARHLSFLDSNLVAKAVAYSTFDAACLLKRGTTLYMQIPPEQLEAAKGLLRCWLSTLIRAIGAGNNDGAEVLFLVDEASAAESLPALEEALVRGRSAGVRLLLAYQSDSQVRAAFPGKPTLLYDNCTTQIYLGASSYETAERISKSLGDFTQLVEGYGSNASSSWQQGSYDPRSQGINVSRGRSEQYSQSGRALLRPEEILTLDDSYLIAFQRGMAPILARRVKWYRDRAFRRAAARGPKLLSFWWLFLAAAVGMIVWALRGNR
jgi:type IV secretion system protein VirD4